METQDKKPDGSSKQGRLPITLSDAYPWPVREALEKLALAAHGCDQAVEHVRRREREAFEYFRPLERGRLGVSAASLIHYSPAARVRDGMMRRVPKYQATGV